MAETFGSITFISHTSGGRPVNIVLGTPIGVTNLLRQQGISESERVTVRLANPGQSALTVPADQADGMLVYPGATVTISPKNVAGF